MRKCYEEDVTAPRVGCSCRACYDAREITLDPRLIALARERHFEPGLRFSPARDAVYQCLQMYLMGRIDWGALYPAIIDALVKQNDDAYGRLLKLAELQAPAPFILKQP
jgi:hypothetical protein